MDVSEPLFDDLLRSKIHDDEMIETSSSSSNSSTDEDPMRKSKDVRKRRAAKLFRQIFRILRPGGIFVTVTCELKSRVLKNIMRDVPLLL